MTELSPAARSLIDAAKGADAPSVEDKLRVQDSLYAKLGISAAAVASSGAAAGTASHAASTATTGGMAGPSGLLSASTAPTVGAAGAGAAIATGTFAKAALAIVAVAGLTVGGYYAFRSDGGANESGKKRQNQTQPTVVAKSDVRDDRPSDSANDVAPTQKVSDKPSDDRASKKPADVDDSADADEPIKKPVVAKRTKLPNRRVKRPRTTTSVAIKSKKPKNNALNSMLEEKRLLTGAHNAERDGDPRLALKLLATHAKKFPNGILAAEREGTRVLALCKLGNKTAAKATATRFLRNWPRHPMAGRVRRSCAN